MMRVGKILLAAVVAALLAGAGSTSLSAATPAGDAGLSKKKAKKFVPKKFKGKWSGTWDNLTFDTSGPASIRLNVKGSKKKPVMTGTFRLGGAAFGCESIDPRPVKMKKGKGKNRWNNGGFKAAWNNGQGQVKIIYNHRKGRISGTGFSPCAREITWSFSGKMNSRSVRGSTEIFANGELFAESTLDMKR